MSLMIRLAIFFSLLTMSNASRSENKASAPVRTGNQEYNEPLKVKGQTRRLNMMLNLKSDAEIKFVRLRKNYRTEILNTQY